MSAPLLEARDFSKSFGGVTAIDGVSLDVAPGEMLGLIGPNGAGKTTMLNLLTGVYRADAGDLFVDGQPLEAGWQPYRLARLGVVRTFQTARVFPNLNVFENVVVGAECLSGGGDWWRNLLPHRGKKTLTEEREERALSLLDLLGLRAWAFSRATDLSSGAQKMVELARVLISNPRVVLLDEPAAGLGESESRRLAESLLAARSLGVSVVLVDHNLRLVMGICDRVVVMDAGRRIAVGRPEEVQQDAAVREAYLGTAAA